MNQSYSKGISWINDVRIPFVDENDIKSQERAFSPNSSSHKGDKWNNKLGWKGSTGAAEKTNTQGRFPANLLVSDDMLNDGVISKSNDNTWIGGMEKNWKGHTNKRVHTYTDKGSNSRFYSLDKWFEKLLEDV